jgi:hypothetical protein
MGEFNSSVTRGWPVFDWLFQSDPTGAAWLTRLLHLGSRAAKHGKPGWTGFRKSYGDIAWKAQIRLRARYRRLSTAGQKLPVVVAAIVAALSAVAHDLPRLVGIGVGMIPRP